MACRAEAGKSRAMKVSPRFASSEGWWEALVMLQFVTSDFVF
jgi:hypothetical protein